MAHEQWTRHSVSSLSGSALWGSFGRYNKIDAVVAGGSPFIATGSRVGVAAVIVGDSTVGGVTASLGGSIISTNLSDNVLYEIGVSEINVASGTIYALYRNMSET